VPGPHNTRALWSDRIEQCGQEGSNSAPGAVACCQMGRRLGSRWDVRGRVSEKPLVWVLGAWRRVMDDHWSLHREKPKGGQAHNDPRCSIIGGVRNMTKR
jgi:hypothetical protein